MALPTGKRLRGLVGSVLMACLVGYFLYHAVQGERGIVSMLQLQNKVKEAQEHLSQVRDNREQLERNVKLLRTDTPDKDMLEEQSRKQLNYARPNEVIVITPPQDLSQRSNHQ